ncbi:uncharacterized protein B0H18DRAFT_1212207 [Fomitopsis serialis]|uniref:uncharacterized protein n=1 Tax=Fomitopsis serialis TaxID=139415 RepID=UPI0020083C5B|nr:uncharacterized protein B0H18DRAFT_1212207 [Neoantrodia serialis]KAH9923495.1 hypothetical protein B0H18DRAFT_1212207 [Neoantrodia serialis]
MPNLHDDAFSGDLTSTLLEKYLKDAGPSASTLINSPGGMKKVTPLAAACWGGRLAVVQLLLKNTSPKLDINFADPNGRTALFFACSRSPSKDRVKIVEALLDANANVDVQFPQDDNSTAIMVALKQLRDKDLVHLLVDRNASLDLENSKRQTARTIAKEVGMEQELLSAGQRKANRNSFIDYIVSTVLFVVSYINLGMIKDAVTGVIGKIFKLSGKRDATGVKEVAKDILSPKVAKEFNDKFDQSTNQKGPDPPAGPDAPTAEPRTVKDFQNVLTDYVTESGLSKFFPRDDPFIQKLAGRAAALRENKSDPLGKPENLKNLITLSLYHPIIYCDDSGSMAADNRYIKQRELVSRIARVATKIVPDDFGVELRFINSRITKSNMTTEEIDQTVSSVSPSGGTRIGTTLKNDILKPFVYDRLADTTNPFKRPYLVCVITDGEPTSEPQSTFKDAIVECRATLDSNKFYPTSVMFCVSQIGDDPAAEAFLDALRNDGSIQDVVHCTAEKLDDKFDELRANEGRLEEWILRLLTKPLMGDD